MMDAVPISVALVAGSLAVFNPCGFTVLGAFLASRLAGGAADPLPARLAQGIASGLSVAVGFVGVFTIIGLPLGYGLAAIADAVPWIGLVFGSALIVVGVGALSGGHVSLPRALAGHLPAPRPATNHVLFGIGHGVASLGCTLPVFLSLLGAASASNQVSTILLVFAAYGLGLTAVLVALATAATLVRGGLARAAKRLMPYVGRLSGGLLAVAGAYLVYYWIRVGFGSPAAAAADPLIATVTDFGAWVEVQAQARVGLVVVLALIFALVVAGVVTLRGQRRVVIASVVFLLLGGLVGLGLGAGGSYSNRPGRSGDLVVESSNDLDARAATGRELQALRGGGSASELSDLRGIAQLRDLFDDAAGRPRIVALLSPTCVTCLRGAAWLQEQLAEHPDADVTVYAVWLPLLDSDDRVAWDDRILTDSRVTHLWDPGQQVGRWYSERGYGDIPVQWDALFVYEPSATWWSRDEPTGLVTWRRPIIAYADELAGHLQALLSP